MIIEWAEFLHYLTIGLTVSINSIGVGIGEGFASAAAIEAINIQPKSKNDIAKIFILGTALIETAAILSVTISIILLFDTSTPAHPFYSRLGELGIAFAICLSGFTVGLFSYLPARAACFATARQPFFGPKILRLMLITQSIIQTPIIFGFIIAIFIKNQAVQAETLSDSLRLLSAGICIGLGSIGPAIGLSRFAESACEGLGVNRKAYEKIFPFTLISQAIIETPLIFSLVVSMLLLVWKVDSCNPIAGIAFISAALCMGFGTIGPGISSEKTASSACKQIAINPDTYSTLSRVSMFSQGLIDTCAIYTLLISLLILLFH